MLARDFYSVGISVLAIVFAVFFAALATIVSASDNEFVSFMEVDGSYTAIIAAFNVSLGLTLVALMFSLFAYAITSLVGVAATDYQPKWFFVIFTLQFFWGLFATYNSAWDAIRYAEFRARFLKKKREIDAREGDKGK